MVEIILAGAIESSLIGPAFLMISLCEQPQRLNTTQKDTSNILHHYFKMLI
jgi:hypothetical protein